MRAETKDGPIDTWMRWTACMKKVRGAWLVTHEHNSYPTDMESNKSLTELKP